MKLAIDAGYRDAQERSSQETSALAAGVVFENWSDATSVQEVTLAISNVAPYEPGSFYRRELPCILKLLDQIEHDIDTIIVDGIVWLYSGDHRKHGLGAHLFDELNPDVVVVGVAKSNFIDSGAVEVLRGRSKRPLFVSAAGIDIDDAVVVVKSMHGRHRLPKLLQRRMNSRGNISLEISRRKVAKSLTESCC